MAGCVLGFAFNFPKSVLIRHWIGGITLSATLRSVVLLVLEMPRLSVKLTNRPRKPLTSASVYSRSTRPTSRTSQCTPDTLFQDALFGLADNVKPGRTPEDILFQLFPKLEIPYTAHIDTFDICGKTVYSVDDDTLVACFDREVPEDVVRAMAQREPAWAVLRDASFTGDDALANFEEIFKTGAAQETQDPGGVIDEIANLPSSITRRARPMPW